MASTFILEKTNPNRDSILENCVRFLRQLPDSKPWEITIKQKTKQRTLPQCRYLNGVAYKILAESVFDGSTRDEVSEFCCGQYFGWAAPTKKLNGDLERRPMRTTTTDENGNRDVLGGREFWDYVEYLQRMAAEQGVYIPDPREEIPEYARAV